MEKLNGYENAGFWIRLLATWIDCLIIYAFLKIIFYTLLYSSDYIYFPFEFTFFIVGLIYSILSIFFEGQTLGKHLLGITVYNVTGAKLSFIQSLLRESILKTLSAIVFLMGFLWIGFTKQKRGWHDYLCKSKVVQHESKKPSTILWRIIAFTSFALFFATYIWNFTSTIIDAKKISISPESVGLDFMVRNSSTVSDVSTLTDSIFVNWLNSNDQTPEDYAIRIAASHQITLFGEMHENLDNLLFFNKILAPLYFKSGIRVVAMEVIPASMNKKVELLVNGKYYDSALAMEIARSQGWKSWGLKQYWDVLETVWKLNHSLPVGAERMRVIGIDNDWLMPNLSLLGLTQDSKGKSSFWEKFRIFPFIKDLPSIIFRDEIMARNIEKEVIAKNQKAIVLIGYHHSMINSTNTRVVNNKLVAKNPRFGVLLSQKYRDKLFQIQLFQHIDFNETNTPCKSSIDDFLDSVMKKRNNKPAGFTMAGSPFEKIRDNCSFDFIKAAAISYADIAQGVIFLKPWNERKECTWESGYISNEMFMNYKPMYELLYKRKLKNATMLNELLVREMGIN